MPYDRKLYPADWEKIAFSIKSAANWTCQNCGRPCRLPGEDNAELADRLSETNWSADLFEDEETEEFGIISVPKFGRFTLTVAHLNHQPSDCSPENLKALCSVCHCRYDLKAIGHKRRLRAERLGQLNLFDQLSSPEHSVELELAQPETEKPVMPASLIAWHQAKADTYLKLIGNIMKNNERRRNAGLKQVPITVLRYEIERLHKMRMEALQQIQL